jgi:hypothetical protein
MRKMARSKERTANIRDINRLPYLVRLLSVLDMLSNSDHPLNTAQTSTQRRNGQRQKRPISLSKSLSMVHGVFTGSVMNRRLVADNGNYFTTLLLGFEL